MLIFQRDCHTAVPFLLVSQQGVCIFQSMQLPSSPPFVKYEIYIAAKELKIKRCVIPRTTHRKTRFPAVATQIHLPIRV